MVGGEWSLLCWRGRPVAWRSVANITSRYFLSRVPVCLMSRMFLDMFGEVVYKGLCAVLVTEFAKTLGGHVLTLA